MYMTEPTVFFPTLRKNTRNNLCKCSEVNSKSKFTSDCSMSPISETNFHFLYRGLRIWDNISTKVKLSQLDQFNKAVVGGGGTN